MHLSIQAAAFLLVAAPLCAAQTPPEKLRVEFEGNRVFPSEQLRTVTTSCYGARTDSRDAFDEDMLDYCLKHDVVEMMRRAGYVRAQFGKMRTAGLGDGLTVTVPVEENEFYRVGRIDIEGATYFDAERLREMLPLKRGDIADTVAVGRWAFEHLQKLYADQGFIQYEADVEPSYRVEPGASGGVVDLVVTVNEGKRFTLRSLKFEGDAGAPVDVLREALGLKEGEVFKQQEYLDAFQKLIRHALFNSEGGRYEEPDQVRDVEFQADEASGDLDIVINLLEKGQERAARPGDEEDEGRPGRPTLKRRP